MRLWDDLTQKPDISGVYEVMALDKPSVAPPNLINVRFNHHAKHAETDTPPASMATRYRDGSFLIWYGSLRPGIYVIETMYWFAIGMLEGLCGGLRGVANKATAMSAHYQTLLIDLRGSR